jgi:adiponectin receptor
MFYIAFGLTSLSFIGHGIVRHGLETQTERMSLKWMGWLASVNLVGAMIYAARVSHRLSHMTILLYTNLPQSLNDG